MSGNNLGKVDFGQLTSYMCVDIFYPYELNHSHSILEGVRYARNLKICT